MTVEVVTRVLRVNLVDVKTGELLKTWITDEAVADVKAAIEDGSQFGLAVYKTIAEYEAAGLSDE